MAAKPKSAGRVAAWRARQKADGLVSVTEMVPSNAAGDVRRLAARLRSDRDLCVGPVRRVSSGKLEKL